MENENINVLRHKINVCVVYRLNQLQYSCKKGMYIYKRDHKRIERLREAHTLILYPNIFIPAVI